MDHDLRKRIDELLARAEAEEARGLVRKRLTPQEAALVTKAIAELADRIERIEAQRGAGGSRNGHAGDLAKRRDGLWEGVL